MPTVKQYAKNIANNLKNGVVEKGKVVGVAVENQKKGEDIVSLVNELLPGASDDWELKIIVVGDGPTVH